MSYLHDLIAPGIVLPFAGAVAPNGWLICNGQAVSRTTYAGLFEIIGTTYGAGNGSTTFNVPDLRGEFIRGLDGGRGVDAGRVLGSSQASTTVRAGGVDSVADSTHTKPVVTVINPDSQANAGVGAQRLTIIKTQTGLETPGTITDNGVRPRNVAMNHVIKT